MISVAMTVILQLQQLLLLLLQWCRSLAELDLVRALFVLILPNMLLTLRVVTAVAAVVVAVAIPV